MRKARTYIHASALPAIAAALALSSTPLGAQQTPVTTEPSTATPTPTPTPAPETPAPSTIDTSTLPPADTTAPAAKTVSTRTVTRTRHVAAAKPPRPATRTVTHASTTHAAARTSTATAPPASAPTPVAQASHQPPPVVNMKAAPAPAATPAAKPAGTINNRAMLIGGAVLVLIILAIAAFAMARARRRRREEQEWADAQSMAYEPFETAPAAEPELRDEQPATVGPEASAFAWGNDRPAEEVSSTREADDDRRPGESWVERAYRGPSPANPSVSLKARLKRAAFFDKREREAAAGLAEPVDPSAGLPDSMEQRELA